MNGVIKSDLLVEGVKEPLSEESIEKYRGQVRCIVQDWFTSMQESVREKPDIVPNQELTEMIERITDAKRAMETERREG